MKGYSVSKKIIIMLMIVSLSLSMVSWQGFLNIFAAVATYGQTDDGVWAYKVLNTVTKTVSIRPSDLGELKVTKVEIPSSVIIQGDSYTVEEIGSYAYYNCFCADCLRANKMSLSTAWEDNNENYATEVVEITINELEIPTSVITIDEGAFCDCLLDKVIFQENTRIATIGMDAFCGTTLRDIEIPSTVTTIESGAFSYSELENISFEEGIQITEIEAYTFDGTYLETISIPESVTSISEGAFYDCDLKEIIIPKSVKNIGFYAFEGNQELKNVSFAADGALKTIRKGAFMECDLTEIAIPASVDTIGRCAFGNNDNLHTVTFQTKSMIDTLHNRSFAKIPGYDYEADSVDDDYLDFEKNTSVTKVNVENYDVYQWIVNKNIFKDSTTIYSANTRVFLDEQKDKNSQGDIGMKDNGQATLHIDDYVSLEKGYHFEGSKFIYSGTLNLTETTTKDIAETDFVSYGYPYVVIKVNQEINTYEIDYETYTSETSIENSKCQYDSSVIISTTVPIRSGYEFLGWSNNASGEGELYQPGQVVDESFTDKDGEVITLHAIWKEITKKVTIYFSTPKNISSQYGFEIIVMKNGAVIQQYDVESSDVETTKIVLSGAKIGEFYTIKCTNYKKEKGKKTYYQGTTKEVTIE